MSLSLLLIGFGPHARHKYIPLIQNAIATGLASSYSILELESNRLRIEREVESFSVKPKDTFFVPDLRDRHLWYSSHSDAMLNTLRATLPDMRIIISTEPKAHFGYLKWCITNQIDCLVDKPITIPMSASQVIDLSRLSAELNHLVDLSRTSPGNYSVMTPRRYHYLYELVKRYLRYYIHKFNTPITYTSIFHCEGVWNLPKEFLEREDHPYKYGYGELLHSGYHYVDVLQGFIELNYLLSPSSLFSIDIKSLVAKPQDQSIQTPEHIRKYLKNGNHSDIEWADDLDKGSYFGETDVVSVFSIKEKSTEKVLMLGDLSLLQTSTSLRNWCVLPGDKYNKTGRFAVEELRVNLGFLLSLSLKIYKVPIQIDDQDIRLGQAFEILIRRNSSIVKGPALRQEGNLREPFEDPTEKSYLEQARWKLFERWLRREESRSQLSQHLSTVKLLEKILLSTL
jgi:hypothetical protein